MEVRKLCLKTLPLPLLYGKSATWLLSCQLSMFVLYLVRCFISVELKQRAGR